MTEIKTNDNIGQIQIADEVIAIIAGTAAMEIEGVVGTTGNFTVGLADSLLGKKNLGKGVRVEVQENTVFIEINLVVRFGAKIQEVTTEVQKRVKTAIETMTGLHVSEVNIHVSNVQFDKEKQSAGLE